MSIAKQPRCPLSLRKQRHWQRTSVAGGSAAVAGGIGAEEAAAGTSAEGTPAQTIARTRPVLTQTPARPGAGGVSARSCARVVGDVGVESAGSTRRQPFPPF